MTARLVVVWRVTTRCNLRCGFCAYDRRLPFERTDVSGLVVQEFARALREHARSSGQSVHLSLLGGEPMLWQPLPELEAALQLPERAHTDLSLGITTNGTTLANPTTRARLLAHYAELTVSIDSPDIEHDELRGWHGGFDKLMQSLSLLIQERSRAKAGLRIRVNTVLMRQTLPRFAELCRLLASVGIDEVTYNQLGGVDRPEFFPEHALSMQDLDHLDAILPSLQRELSQSGLLLRGQPRYVERMRRASLGRALPIVDCHPGERFLFVDELGRVSPCSFTSDDYALSVSALRTSADVAQLPSHLATLRNTQRATACDDCRSTQLFAKWAAPKDSASDKGLTHGT